MKDVNIKFIVMILFSWVFFIGAILLGIFNHIYLPIEQDILNVFSNGYITDGQKYFHWLFIIGYFGPLLTYVWYYKQSQKKSFLKLFEIKKIKEYFQKKKSIELFTFKGVKSSVYFIALIIPFVIFGLIFLADRISGSNLYVQQYNLIYVFVLFLFMMLTFSTSEFFFRKYCLEKIKKEKEETKAIYMVSVMSILWVLPFIGYFNFIYGYSSLIISVIAYALFYLSVSTILSIVYLKYKNILLNWLISAWAFTAFLYTVTNFYGNSLALLINATAYVLIAIYLLKFNVQKS